MQVQTQLLDIFTVDNLIIIFGVKYMKIDITDEELSLLTSLGYTVDLNKDYCEDELLEIAEDIFELEAFNYQENYADNVAKIADKVYSQVK